MTGPESINEFTRLQSEYYKSAGRAANLWYTLTLIKLIFSVLFIIALCVGGILSAGTITLFIQSLTQNFSNFGY